MIDVSFCIDAEAVPFFTAPRPPAAWPLGALGYIGIAGKPGLLNTGGVSTPAELLFPLVCRTPNSEADLILANIQVTRAGQPVSGTASPRPSPRPRSRRRASSGTPTLR